MRYRIPFLTGIVAVAATASAQDQFCTQSPHASIPDCQTTYKAIEEINTALRPDLTDLTQNTDYFSYYRLDLYGTSCPFWSEDGTCGNIACAVTTIDNEDDIPPIWRAEELSKLAGPKAAHPKNPPPAERPLSGQLGDETSESCVIEADECDERDYCIPDDQNDRKGDYVSLLANPERFTGYAGSAANNVWEAIYRENCFSKPNSGVSSFGFSDVSQAKLGFVNIMQDRAAHKLGPDSMGQPKLPSVEVDDECLEKRVFYRLISGMHSSISVHLCWDYLNQTTGTWSPNAQCFEERFNDHMERIDNLYFNYALLLRAVQKLKHYVPQYTFCASDYAQNRITKEKFFNLINLLPEEKVYDESKMFLADSQVPKEEFMVRIGNVSRIMDCVGCDKCRMWGKLQIQGYQTAIKVLYYFDEDADYESLPHLRRTEIVALVNTLDRLSHSISVLPKFYEMIEAKRRAEAGIAEDPKIIELIEDVNSNEKTSTNSEIEIEKTPISEDDEDFDNRTISEVFWAELSLVFRIWKFVIKSWYYFPKLMYVVSPL
ncbi:endoplasmic reticulum Oxidoreductin 1-domain-containing protein [Pyronema omphalodes]|nr:endoplasmic reticulum Oxidoreductin 1-domain-containing protein [Pyronema omphalodes]